MINITDEAAKKITEILKLENMSHAGLRISTGGGSSCCGPQYEISIDEKTGTGDTVVEKLGAKIYPDADANKKLEGAELAFINDERGQGFVLSFPGQNTGGGCGCSSNGSSGSACGSGGGSSKGGCGCG